MSYKLLLDEDVLAAINKHYSSLLTKECLSWSCFSDPDLTMHVCNALAPLPGGLSCPVCGNLPERVCSVTCHISHVCIFARYITVLHNKPENIKQAFLEQIEKIPRYRRLIELLNAEKVKPLPCNKELSIQDVSRILGVHTVTVYNKIKKGLLPATKKGKRFFITNSDLDTFLANNKVRKRRKKSS